MRVHLEVAHGRLALDEVAIVLGEEHRDLDVLARERLHVVERPEEEDGLELRAAVDRAAEHERAAAATERAGRAHPALLEIGGVLRAVLCARRAAPHPS